MSRYEWERGEVIIPSKEWSGLKKTIRESYNKRKQEERDLAINIYERVTARGKPYQLTSNDLISMRLADRSRWGDGYQLTDEGNTYEWMEIAKALGVDMKSWWRGSSGESVIMRWDKKPKKPTKKKLDENLPLATVKTKHFRLPEADISLIEREVPTSQQIGTRKEKKEVWESHGPYRFGGRRVEKEVEVPVYKMKKQRVFKWEVEENNHAVEEAHEHPVTRAAFRALKDIPKWPKGTGGTIRYYDEYSRDEGLGASDSYAFGAY
jgi:hypothetical protein